MFAASAALMASGRVVMGQEKEQEYISLLSSASERYTTDFDGAINDLSLARRLFPDRIDADRQETYALYLNGKWQECIDFGADTLAEFGEDSQTRVTMASAQFELGDYEAAAEGFAQGGDLSADNLRDYAVCLGRLGQIDAAELVLDDLIGKGANADVTQYVQGEVYLAQENYVPAEAAFLDALDQADSPALTRRCYISLGDLYRSCAALVHIDASPIENPSSKSVKLLSEAVVNEGLQHDSALWEMLAMAYFEAYHTDASAPPDYLTKAADCFHHVIDLGVTKEYLYANLYAIYYEMKDFTRAEQALSLIHI